MRSLNNKRILVTGASGFIGSRLCRILHNQEVELHGVSRKSMKDRGMDMRWWVADLTEMDRIKTVLGRIRPDIIFHLASHVVGARTMENVMPAFRNNLQSTVNLLAAATEIGCQKLVLAGSQEEPLSEDVDAIPSSPYAAAKWSASAYARMFHALYHTPVSVARIYMVYGPAQGDETKLIPYVTTSLLQKTAPKLTGGTRKIDWIYVDDVAKGLLSIALAKNVDGRTIDIGSGTSVSIKDTVIKLQRIVNNGVRPLFGDIPDRPMETIRVADMEETFNLIGWNPEISLRQGLEKVVAWYKHKLGLDFS